MTKHAYLITQAISENLPLSNPKQLNPNDYNKQRNTLLMPIKQMSDRLHEWSKDRLEAILILMDIADTEAFFCP